MSLLSFSTESGKKPTIYDLLFLDAIHFPEHDNKHPSGSRN